MRQLRQSGTPIILPALVIVEIAAAIGRGQGKPEPGHAFALPVSRFPELTLVSVAAMRCIWRWRTALGPH